mmetsp:Transcript_78756/g.218893  ORF Transcript_78756/g.218893 Transcript_78756/m.218893 type:complete len:452 (-) Transcript_78756:692-2047(-)
MLSDEGGAPFRQMLSIVVGFLQVVGAVVPVVGGASRAKLVVFSCSFHQTLQPTQPPGDDTQLQPRPGYLAKIQEARVAPKPKVFFEPRQAYHVRLGHENKLVGAEVHNGIQKEVGTALAQAGPHRQKPREELVEPRVAAFARMLGGGGSVFGGCPAGPVLRKGEVYLGHSQHRVQEWRSAAKDSDVATHDANRKPSRRLDSPRLVEDTQELHGDEVVPPVVVDLCGALLDDVLNAEGVQGVLHREGEQRCQIELVQMNPTYKRCRTLHLRRRPVPEEELAHRPRVGNVLRGRALRAVVHDGEAGGKGLHKQVREPEPGENALEVRQQEASFLVLGDGRKHLRKSLVVETGDPTSFQTIQELPDGGDTPIGVAVHALEDFTHPLWGAIEEVLQHSLTSVADVCRYDARTRRRLDQCNGPAAATTVGSKETAPKVSSALDVIEAPLCSHLAGR